MSFLAKSIRYVGDGSSTAYDLSSPTANSTNILVIINGLVQVPDVDYTVSESTAYLITTVPEQGADIEFREYSITDVGFQGSEGAQGPQGEVGYQGSQGFIGPVGYTGSAGTGSGTGAGALNIVFSDNDPVPASSNTLWWNSNTGTLFVYYQDGSSSQWVAASPTASTQANQGPRGYDGSTGYTGSQGIPGEAAAVGYTGSQGETGYFGSVGYTGSRGLDGVSGNQGPQGTKGYDGSRGYDGSVGPQGPQGPAGEAAAKGFDGSAGPQGPKGFDGSVGPQGPKGFDGSRGDKGSTGSTGPAGPTGPQGPKGDPGTLPDFTSACSGTVTRTFLSKVRDIVNVLDFGADPTGASDSTTAFQNAINCLGIRGGTVYVPPGQFLILNNLYIGDVSSPYTINNITLQGPYGAVNRGQNYDVTTMSCIKLSSSATIRIMAGGALHGMCIMRNGLVQSGFAPASYAGQAITVEYSEVSIRDCMILGFNQAIYGDFASQLKVVDVWIDCTNGVKISNSYDITYLNRVHCWPFVNVGAQYEGQGAHTRLHRSGSAFHLLNVNDWTKITDCFSYGYFRGFRFSGGDECIVTGCGSDNTTPQYPGAIGFLVEGTVSNLSLNNCQAAASPNGFYIVPNWSGCHVRMNGCSAWGNPENGIVVASGIASIVNSTVRNAPTGIAAIGGTTQALGLGFSGVNTTTSGTVRPIQTTFTF